MTYLRTFAPWIVYALIPTADWQWGAAAAFIVALAVIGYQARTGAAADSMIIEIGSALFFCAFAILAFTDPHSALQGYAAATSSGVLAVIAWVSLAIGRPFTLGIAKQTTPRQLWDHPVFRRVNVIITTVWAAAFTAAAVVLAALGGHPGTAGTVVQIAGFVVPMLFTIRYVALVQARTAGQTG